MVSCGYKWLYGPYATRFAWLHPALANRLRPQQAYWLTMQAGRGLDQMRQTTIRDGHRHERLTGAGIDTAYREGNLRLSPHLFTPQATSITHSTFCTPDPQRKFAAPGKHPDHAQIPARAHGQGAEATYSALRDVAWSVIRMSVCRSSRKSVTLG